MKILKKIGMVLLAVIALLIVVSFFISPKVHIERSMVMKAPREAVYNQLVDVKALNTWSPWVKMDPKTELTYGDITSGVGASYSWKSEMMGNGTLTITGIDADSVANNLAFEDGESSAYYKLEDSPEGLKVTWGFDGDMSKPFVLGKYLGLMMDGMMGGTFESGLHSLDSVALLNNVQATTVDSTATETETESAELTK